MLVLRSGGDFNLTDVLLLSHHLKRLNSHANIYCLCNGINKPIKLFNFVLLPMKAEWKGWWAKMNLFAPEYDYLRPFLYMDLDTAVLQPVQSFFTPEHHENQFIMLRDFYRSKLNVPASGVMWIPNNDKVKKVWNKWVSNSEMWMRRFRGDQEFIGSVTRPDLFWQDLTNGIVTFKPNRKWRTELEGKECVVCFHGKPRIPEAVKTVEWVNVYYQQQYE